MRHCDTLIAPRWCIPVEPSGAVLDRHAVIVTDGKIADLLPLEKALQSYQPSVLLERPEHALIPGLINAHTHAAMTLLRGLAEDLPLQNWLRDGVWPAEKRWVSAEMVRDGTELAIAEMISAGITCFSDQYFFPEIVAETAVDLDMRAVVGTPVVDIPTSWAHDAEEYLSKGSDLVHDPYAEHPLISTCFAPHSISALSDEWFTKLRVMADQLDVPVQMHLHETRSEIASSLEKTGKRPCARLDELGLVNASLLAVHAVHMTDAELARFAEAGVQIAHCPRSNLKLASGIAPIARYRAAGVNVAIGTDGAASNNVLDLLSEIRLAALLAKVSADDAAAISASEALFMGTLGAARALGLADVTGSIATGKWADLACVDLGSLNSQPIYDVPAQLVYTAGSGQVTDVWIAGKHQLDNGKLACINTDELLQRSNEWRDRIAATVEQRARQQ
ncbi:MAG: TRZ/ATZ family hydrolase [Gammaproteobacteria bacterium]|nr:TRZ/ATZ family hydrolase [Gammaproteobacteria bacterium]MBT8111504.1 TRZ/ATZ family hydrolase [Gammaproteobacteria bacterium]NND47731.1 TRZ/ATZ family hydrolase [Woeseiaceae bacterium]NNL46202.1 TRZ/ATZ family hydrolase [Woeseiaceae bacterium]